MQLAVDAMGGDHAPKEVVAGVLEALPLLADTDRIVLIGQEDRIREELKGHCDWNGDSRIEILHAGEVIDMGDHPVHALRKKKDSSIAKMAGLLAEGKVDGVVSAGNTGACVAACQMKVRPIKGVARPGIAVVIPSFGGPMILCDVGANPMPKANHLYQYALMASVYAKVMFDMDDEPRVAMLSIGEEDAKGNPLVKEARDLIKADDRLNYVGNVEGRNLLAGQAEVVICDGFVGNVVIKLIEGLTESFNKMLLQRVGQADAKSVEVLGPLLKEICQRHDYTEYGGAPLLGVDGVCIIAHGSSDRTAIKNAVLGARRLAQQNVTAHLAEFMDVKNLDVSEAR